MPGKSQPRLTKKEKKAQTQNLVNKAKQNNDVLLDFKDFTSYKKHELDLTIEFKKSQDMKTEEMDVVFDLLRNNMKELYEKSDWGWNEDTKREEFESENSRFLLVRDTNSKVVGFSLFQFDVEVNLPILYCYELQIDSQYQRKGVGRHLMKILALIAYKFKLLKIVLTVFKDNDAGINFYMNSLSFRRDETCPYDEEEKCYLILRKSIDKAEIDSMRI